MEIHPSVLQSELPGGGEELLLEPVAAAEVAAQVSVRAALLIVAAAFALSCAGLGAVSALEPSAVREALALLCIASAAGGGPIGALLLYRELLTSRQPHRRLVLDPLGVQIGRQQLRWGELEAVEPDGDGLRFVLDSGEEQRIRLHYQPAERVAWLAAHLSARLEQAAPGSPEDVPAALRSLQREPTPSG